MSRRLAARAVLLSFTALVGAALVSVAPGAAANTHQRWRLATVGPFGGEPSIASDPRGALYDITPSGGMVAYRSTNQGGRLLDPDRGRRQEQRR